MADRPDKIKFHYIKGNLFRVIHVDGAIGSISPTGDIIVSLFSQRPPIPQLTVQPVLENGELGEEIVAERVAREGLIREVEVGVTMRPEVVLNLIKFLQEKVDQYQKLLGEKQRDDTKATQ